MQRASHRTKGVTIARERNDGDENENETIKTTNAERSSHVKHLFAPIFLAPTFLQGDVLQLDEV
jgi:hypothetical protein